MIDYFTIAKALAYYKQKGFQLIDTPWSVSAEAMGATSPPHVHWYKHFSRPETYLVASGEQSFLQLILDGKLDRGCYCCVTPCFRNDKPDRLHTSYFLKVELIDTRHDPPIHENLERMMGLCLEFFNQQIPCELVKVEPNNYDKAAWPSSTHDIVTKNGGMELGSYGIRSHSKLGTWIYGTGCAEPRLSLIKKLLQEAENGAGPGIT